MDDALSEPGLFRPLDVYMLRMSIAGLFSEGQYVGLSEDPASGGEAIIWPELLEGFRDPPVIVPLSHYASQSPSDGEDQSPSRRIPRPSF